MLPKRGSILTNALHEKLKYLRLRHNLTQSELAHKLGLASHSHVAKLETGQRTASLDLVVRASILFGTTTDYLLRNSITIEDASGGAPTPMTKISGQFSRFGAKLRALRLHHAWGQTELARRLSLARRGYISNLETGRKLPSLELVVAIADLFGVTTDVLLRDELPVPSLEVPE
jgi:transcriptional regulator with XRE-family HTH domain